MKKLLPPHAMVLTLSLSMLLAWLCPCPCIPIAGKLSAALLIPFGLALAVTGSRRFEKVRTNIHSFQDPNEMVTRGPFAYSRNPMYLGLLAMTVGAALLLGPVYCLIPPLLFFLWLERVVIPFEEARMTAVFGDTYDQYKRQVH